MTGPSAAIDHQRLEGLRHHQEHDDHQIILFSKDESLADRAEKAADDWNIIRLPGPAVAPAPAEAAPANGSSPVSEEEEVPR